VVAVDDDRVPSDHMRVDESERRGSGGEVGAFFERDVVI